MAVVKIESRTSACAPSRRSWHRRLKLAIIGATVASSIAVAVSATSTVASATTFVVNSAVDAPDSNPGDGVCAVAGSGFCTLRAAIQESEGNQGRDTVAFAIPGDSVQRIVLASPLPLIRDTKGVVIDGFTQPGSQRNTADVASNAVLRIEIQGAGPNGFDGFDLRSANSLITGVALFDFRIAVRMLGPAATGNVLVGTNIGTDAVGTFGQPSRVVGATGVLISFGASGNIIGQPGNALRNVIAGNGDHGVALFDSGTNSNRIQNNVVGLSPSGQSRLANHGHGVDINFNSSSNIVGGSLTGEGNVISGNNLSGVEVSHDAGVGTTTNNLIAGNLIGTTPDGLAAPTFARNIQYGVNLEGKARCADSCTSDISFNRVENNVVVGSTVGILIWKGAHDNVVAANTVGVLGTGSPAESSSATVWGVLISTGAYQNRIEANTISGVARGISVRADDVFPGACLASDVVCPADAEFPTYANLLRSNSIDDISKGLGIDLLSKNASGDWIEGPNVPPSTLVNSGILAPVIVEALSGQIVVDTCGGCTVELFTTSVPTCTNCWDLFGRGRSPIATARANEAGRVRLASNLAAAGTFVTVTTTDVFGNTSEFSRRVEVAPSTGIGSGAIATQRATRCSISDAC
jgi:CSLREA domain-containing protein